jgi:hypothetical protein
MSREKYSEKEKEVVLMILEKSTESAPVEVSFGYSKNNQCMKGILLKKAPSSILKMLLDEGCTLHLEEDGVHILVV